MLLSFQPLEEIKKLHVCSFVTCIKRELVSVNGHINPITIMKLTSRSDSCSCSWKHTSGWCPEHKVWPLLKFQRPCWCFRDFPTCPGIRSKLAVTHTHTHHSVTITETSSGQSGWYSSMLCHCYGLELRQTDLAQLEIRIRTNMMWAQSDMTFMYDFRIS